nr:hypothetical protein [Tanacetum cinerariifolium]
MGGSRIQILESFLSPSKTTHLKNEITRFTQKFEETFGEAWERFKEMLRQCLHHEFSELHQIDTFYNGLNEHEQDSLNATASGNLLRKTPRNALTIIENKSKVRYSLNKPVYFKVSTTSNGNSSSTDARIDKLTDTISNLVETFNKKMTTPATVKAVEETSVICGGAHPYYDCIVTDSNILSACATTGLGSLPSNTVLNPRADLKAITTRSGVTLAGPSVSPPPSKEADRELEMITDQVLTKSTNNVPPLVVHPSPISTSSTPISSSKMPKVTKDTIQPSTKNIQPPVAQTQVPIDETVVAPKPKPTIPYPSRANKQNLHEKDSGEIFRNLHFELSFTYALLHMPKFALMFKGILNNKEKLFDLATTLVNEKCSAVILKKSPEKLGDPGKFLIPCDFLEFDECLALADLDRSTTRPASISEDVFVKVRKFHFPTDFVVVDYIVDPRVPLILERPFLRTGRALINVYGEELTLCVNDEAIAFKVGQTLNYSYNDAESINRVDVINVACEKYVQEVLGFFDTSKSGNPTLILDPIIALSSPSLTPFEGGDFILEEIEACLTSKLIPLGIDDTDFDLEGDICLLEELLNKDPSSSPLPPKEINVEEIKTIKYSIDEPPKLELKELLSYLEYTFLEGTDKLPVSPVQCVPKKGGMIVVENEDNELIPTRSQLTHKTKKRLPLLALMERLPTDVCLLVYAKLHARSKGAENLAADHLSRIENPYQDELEKKEITKTFPLETLGESVDSAFARLNTIITSLKARDEGYSSKNYVRKFFRALHPKWRANITSIEESKDLTSLSLDELIENLKKESSDEQFLTSESEDKEYTMEVRDFNKFFKRRECPKPSKDKNQRAFVEGSWSDNGEENDEKVKDEMCLVAQASVEVKDKQEKDKIETKPDKNEKRGKARRCSSCGALYTGDFCCSKGNVEEKILVPKLPKNCARCARCGYPFDDPYCQGCALLRKILEEDLVTYFQDFQNTSESSDDSTNVVNAPREPFCQPMNQNFYNSNSSGFDQTQPSQFPVIHPPPQETSIKILHDQENAINSVQTFLRRFNRYSLFETPKVLLLAWDRVFEIKDAFGNKQYKPEDIQELFLKLFNDVQNIHELAEYINTPGWNRPAFYNNGDDDDVDYTIAITPILSTEEPDNSLSMRDEHLDTISATKSDEVIKSSVEDLVSIPGESEGIPDTMCDVHLVNNPTPLEAKDHFEIVINSNDDYSSSEDDSLYNENIEYVEASPYVSELVNLAVAEIVISENKEIEDDNLREKLLNVNLLIVNIEALKDNPTPSSEFLTKSSSTSPKSFLEETNTFDNSLPEFENFCFDLEEISSGSTTTHSGISLPNYEAFYFYDDHIKEISSGSTTTHSDISLSEYDSFIFDLSNDQFPPTDRSDFTHEEFADELAHIISLSEYDCFYFGNLPDPGEWISILNSGIRKNLSSTTRVNLPVEDDHSPLLAYVVWILLFYLTYHVIPLSLHSFGNEDTIFDPGIAINRFYSFKPGLSHRCGTFKKFNTHRSHLNESLMEMLFSTCFPMDQ